MSYGFTDPFWMAEKLITNAHPLLVKRAAIHVLRHLEQVEITGDTSPLRILEILVQVCATGEYIQQSHEVNTDTVTLASFDLHDGKLSPEDEAKIKEFTNLLGGLPDADEDKSYEDWLKDLGIPNLDDFRKDDEDE